MEQFATSEPAWRYNAQLAQKIEEHWQEKWDKEGTFWAANVEGTMTDGEGNLAGDRKPYFVMDMFPYPSGRGLHVGHPLGYIATDVVARFHRMKGENVLHTLGYDAFGLPAEQFAVQTGQHPRITTEENIANMRRQLHRMGLGHDSRRSFATIEPGYVHWTQWIFTRIFNSWYDEEFVRADGGKGSARPISELIEKFRSGAMAIPGFDDVSWDDLEPKQQDDVLNEFRLAYISKSPVNWCPGLGTVLANEEVTADGRSERGNYPVFQRELSQWSMRITKYGHRLIEDLDTIDWPDKVKSMQRNWIGESHGASVHFEVPTSDGSGNQDLEVYTTRADTLFGTTFAVVAVDHPLLDHVPANWSADIPQVWRGGYENLAEAVVEYRRQAMAKTAMDRVNDNGAKTGFFSGLYAINPITGAQIPVFVSDYVLMSYGTGAIMAVPGGDQRDYDFAQAFELPVIYTVEPDAASGETLADDYEGQKAYTSHEGRVINSHVTSTHVGSVDLNLDGMEVDAATQAAIAWLEEQGVGKGTTSYRLRDWLFSRQRYWGEPFPIVYDKNGVAHTIPDSMLPLNLPDVPDYSPRTYDPMDSNTEPEAPLSRNEEWVNVTLDLGDGNGPQEYRRDTNTMPQWAGSCWYYMRYTDPQNPNEMVNPEEFNYWLGANHNDTVGKSGGVDLYVGGVEHAVLHLLYSRFWHKVLFDLGIVSTPEPFHKLFNQGYIQAYAYTDERGQYVPAAEVEEVPGDNGEITYEWNGQKVNREFGKMGKSLKNIITPDDMYDEYGADTFRLYEMSMGPLDESRPWNVRNVIGSQRFLQRLWRNVIDENTGEVIVSEDELDDKTAKLLNNTIAEVTEEMENMRPNTTISRLIVLNNHLTSFDAAPRKAIEPLILMLAPIAPHICEELWNKLGHEKSIAHAQWPQADERFVGNDTVTAVVQIKGKVRGKLEVSPDISAEDLEAQALALPAIVERLGGVAPRKVIVKAPRIVSIVPGE
ncbi:leucine--tRNA ligase [Alloscardovia theropitheci]|uniref:Leucine--tRNA ligase n=1 Tax=Alloscardovia theropitheci TaxID=2496842 RepID=A0A4R0QN02_9BIFI|nr:leucine--tRNA ligase [Alloscardovia theropitheci]TCD53553.1 leucine--tRNA ligase [Alloscardovia theropitheci]